MNKVHFIAIGGAIMHQLAMALQRQGTIVTGSDDEINDPALSNLKKAGLLPERSGWFPEKITKDLHGIVLGMHARADNPELLRAQELNIPIFSFPEYIYNVSQNKKRLVIAGSHGKTTITSMIMHVLKSNNMEFDYLVGAKVNGFEESVRLSDAPLIILEGDEYPASIIEKRPKIFFYHPHISVLSGIAWDHINVFPTYDIYKHQFETYLATMANDSLLFYNDEDKEVRKVVDSSSAHISVEAYTTPPFHYANGEVILDTEIGEVPVAIFGRHNILNLEAARMVCNELGVDDTGFYSSIATFTGAARRLETICKTDHIVAYRDFAHAPSKLKATLNAVREALPHHKLVACFELHTYSSLNADFLKEYEGSMTNADTALVYYSAHALELKHLPPLNKNEIRAYFATPGLVIINDKDELLNTIKHAVTTSTTPVCLLLMSSGTFDGLSFQDVCNWN